MPPKKQLSDDHIATLSQWISRRGSLAAGRVGCKKTGCHRRRTGQSTGRLSPGVRLPFRQTTNAWRKTRQRGDHPWRGRKNRPAWPARRPPRRRSVHLMEPGRQAPGHRWISKSDSLEHRRLDPGRGTQRLAWACPARSLSAATAIRSLPPATHRAAWGQWPFGTPPTWPSTWLGPRTTGRFCHRPRAGWPVTRHRRGGSAHRFGTWQTVANSSKSRPIRPRAQPRLQAGRQGARQRWCRQGVENLGHRDAGTKNTHHRPRKRRWDRLAGQERHPHHRLRRRRREGLLETGKRPTKTWSAAADLLHCFSVNSDGSAYFGGRQRPSRVGQKRGYHAHAGWSEIKRCQTDSSCGQFASFICGCSSMVERKLPKLDTGFDSLTRHFSPFILNGLPLRYSSADSDSHSGFNSESSLLSIIDAPKVKIHGFHYLT